MKRIIVEDFITQNKESEAKPLVAAEIKQRPTGNGRIKFSNKTTSNGEHYINIVCRINQAKLYSLNTFV